MSPSSSRLFDLRRRHRSEAPMLNAPTTLLRAPFGNQTDCTCGSQISIQFAFRSNNAFDGDDAGAAALRAGAHCLRSHGARRRHGTRNTAQVIAVPSNTLMSMRFYLWRRPCGSSNRCSLLHGASRFHCQPIPMGGYWWAKKCTGNTLATSKIR